MISGSTLRLIALAIAGVLVAAAVAVAASQLASRQIGLASEPVSAGDELAPPRARPESERHDTGESRPIEGGKATTAPSTTTPSAEAEPAPPATEPESGAEPPTGSESPAEPSPHQDDSSESHAGGDD
jgi:hypothetical protein